MAILVFITRHPVITCIVLLFDDLLVINVAKVVCRTMYLDQLDPIVVALQCAIDKEDGLSKDHIFYKLIHNALLSASSTVGRFQWPEDIVDFANTIEMNGGGSTVNLMRGPGDLRTDGEANDKTGFWDNFNIPLPSKRTRQRRKCPAVTTSGVITDNLKNFQAMAHTSSDFISTDRLKVTPVCLSRDAMAIKPSGDIDNLTNTIVGMTQPIDITYVKENPYPDCDELKRMMYTEAGTIIGTTLDNHIGLSLANDFLTSKTSGADVLKTLDYACKAIQCCEACLNSCKLTTVPEDISCNSVCYDCLSRKELCESCISCHKSIYPQLRACSRCVCLNIQCRKLAVLAITMDCESNNALAMRSILEREDLPAHMQLVNAIPDEVHAGKKTFRASANWWLLKDGYRINNMILRSLRQYDDKLGPKLRPVISDSSLRNRDRMDFQAILEATSPKLQSVIADHCETEKKVTVTLFPDPFWRAKSKGVLDSITDICEGE